MSTGRWLLSLFFVWHLVAIALGSVASPGAVLPVGPPRHPDNDRIAAVLTPPLDRIAATLAPVPAALSRAAGPLQRLSERYLEMTGTAPSWKMFSNPPEVHQYLRVRYYVSARGADGAGGAATWTATELVLPAHREDEIRWFRAYWAAFRDKALTSALQRFHLNRSDRLVRPETTSTELPDDLAPVARYFARRFERRALRVDEHITRTEVWYGVAPMAPPAVAIDRRLLEARRAVLRRYYQGPVEDHFGPPAHPPYHGTESEADIQWVLEYLEP
jgi:hypothetical protein